MAAQTLDARANETWYLFGDTLEPRWAALQKQYAIPMDGRGDDPVAALGVGGRFSGVSFHTHGPGYSESILGAKRW